MVVFLGGICFPVAVANGLISHGNMSFLAIPVSLLLLAAAFIFAGGSSRLALFVPLLLFASNSTALHALDWYAPLFLPACILSCVISLMYGSFGRTLVFAALQSVAVIAFYFIGFQVAENGPSQLSDLGGLLVFLSCNAVLVAVLHPSTKGLAKLSCKAQMFGSCLNDTENCTAVLDKSNRVVYINRHLCDFAGIKNPDFAKGRPFIDIFPVRLKLMAHRMLGSKQICEKNWDCTVGAGRRRYRAVCAGIGKNGEDGKLFTMLDITNIAGGRSEIAAIKGILKTGVFFMDSGFVIKEDYSDFLEELLSQNGLGGKRFTDIISGSIPAQKLEDTKKYLAAFFNKTESGNTMKRKNPLDVLVYSDPAGMQKTLQCTFTSVEPWKGEKLLFATVHDITDKMQMQEMLNAEENKRYGEIPNLFEILHLEPEALQDFQEEMEYQTGRANAVLAGNMKTHDKLESVSRYVNTIKSVADNLGLKTFFGKASKVEAYIKSLLSKGTDAGFEEMMELAVKIEKLSMEKEVLRSALGQISSFNTAAVRSKSSTDIFPEFLGKAAGAIATETGKKIKFLATDIDNGIMAIVPRRTLKAVLVLLIRNRILHGMEMPAERTAGGKNASGTIRLSIKKDGENITARLADDGRGIDFGRIGKAAVAAKILSEKDAQDKNMLVNAMFSPLLEESGMAKDAEGLSIARDYVKEAGGTIRLHTQTGKGTVFSIFLPAVKDKAIRREHDTK